MTGAQHHAYKPKKQALTVQENRVLGLIVNDAACNEDIARALSISPETVKRHLSNIMNKTGYSTRLELAVRTLQKRQEAAPHCACSLVRARFIHAFEQPVLESKNTRAQYLIYDDPLSMRCLGRSNKSFAAAWRMAAELLSEIAEC